MKRELRLHIDELVLHGFAPGDRHAIARAITGELGRLLGGAGLPCGLAHPSRHALVDGGSFDVPRGASAEVIGAQVAQTLYATLQGDGTRPRSRRGSR